MWKYGDERRSLIEYSGGDVSIEDLIADEMYYYFSCRLYKRTNLSNTKLKIEGEKSAEQRSRFLRAHVCSYKSSIYDVLYSKRKMFLRVYEIPEGSRQLKVGRFKILLILKVMIGKSLSVFKIWKIKITSKAIT
jgi:DNA gyrase subunit A